MKKIEEEIRDYVVGIFGLCKEEAEACVQETFVRVLVDPGGEKLLWHLLRVARNICCDEWRLQKKMRKHREPYFRFYVSQATTLTNDSNDPAIKMIVSEEEMKNRRLINNALEKLKEISEQQHEVYLLRYKYELEYKQIADMLGTEIKGLYKLIHDAKKELRKWLAVPFYSRVGLLKRSPSFRAQRGIRLRKPEIFHVRGHTSRSPRAFGMTISTEHSQTIKFPPKTGS